jgi:hypothetical protein
MRVRTAAMAAAAGKGEMAGTAGKAHHLRAVREYSGWVIANQVLVGAVPPVEAVTVLPADVEEMGDPVVQ